MLYMRLNLSVSTLLTRMRDRRFSSAGTHFVPVGQEAGRYQSRAERFGEANNICCPYWDSNQ